jgi:2-phospho-L-lactate guanylyltransferase
MDAGLLPVKPLDRAKGRLAEHFSHADRTAIARALFEDALSLCAGADFLSWWAISDDPDVLSAASARGLATIADHGAGLNPALARAISIVTDAGARSVTIIPSDVPMATPADVIDLLDTGSTSDIVVVPSRSDGGTNALHLRPPDVIAPQFGPGSFAAHVKMADERKLRCSILPAPRLELDIDTIEDVDAFLGAQPGGGAHTTALLGRLRRQP